MCFFSHGSIRNHTNNGCLQPELANGSTCQSSIRLNEAALEHKLTVTMTAQKRIHHIVGLKTIAVKNDRKMVATNILHVWILPS
jgi:hypothetical protein